MFVSLCFEFSEGKEGEHHAKLLQTYCDDIEKEALQGFLSDGEFQCIRPTIKNNW